MIIYLNEMLKLMADGNKTQQEVTEEKEKEMEQIYKELSN